MKDKQVCSECGGAINTNKGIRAKLKGKPPCPIGCTVNPTTEEATNNVKKNLGFGDICNKNPWKYKWN